jgi:hypothetical protein
MLNLSTKLLTREYKKRYDTILLQGITARIKPNSWFFRSKYSDYWEKKRGGGDRLVGKFSSSVLFQEDSFEHAEQILVHIGLLCLLTAS